MTIYFPFLGFAVFLMGLTAIQRGEVAWSRTKTISGQHAKIIGVVLIVLGIILTLFSVYFSYYAHMTAPNMS